MTDSPTVDAPKPFAAGTFAIYELPDGGALLVTQMPHEDGTETEDRKVIPPPIMKMIRKLGNGDGVGRGLLGRRLAQWAKGAD